MCVWVLVFDIFLAWVACFASDFLCLRMLFGLFLGCLDLVSGLFLGCFWVWCCDLRVVDGYFLLIC